MNPELDKILQQAYADFKKQGLPEDQKKTTH